MERPEAGRGRAGARLLLLPECPRRGDAHSQGFSVRGLDNAAVYVHEDSENVLDRTIFHSIYDMTLKTVQISLLPEKNRINNEFFKFSL